MKTLLLLNGANGSQIGTEDGFNYLLDVGLINDLKCFYLDSYSKITNDKSTLVKVFDIANKMQPELIVIFHISKFKITSDFLVQLKELQSKPVLVYDEGDMYGGFGLAKPITKSMKTIMKNCDVVSIRGLGKFYKQISRFNKRIIYTPHHANIARFDTEPYLLTTKKNKLVFVGNKNKTKLLSSVRRLPGAKQREDFIIEMGKHFPNEFILYGNGWDKCTGNQGPVEFTKQLDVYRNSWITLSYEHYPEIPYYFSNRLPIALLAGSLYVCHYHKGYENMFKNCDFIFFFNSNAEATDIINYVLSLSKEELFERSHRAREFALKHFHPNVTWVNFFNNVNRLVESNYK